MSEPEPSDTLYVQVTDVQHPVTEEVLRQVFEPTGAVQRVQIFPTVGQATKTTAAIVQFSSKDAANAARRKRDGVKIYPGCNRMENHVYVVGELHATGTAYSVDGCTGNVSIYECNTADGDKP